MRMVETLLFQPNRVDFSTTEVEARFSGLCTYP